VADNTLPTASHSLLSTELQHLHSNITIYCDDLMGTVPSLKQFAARTVSQLLFRNQVIHNYLIWYHLAWRHPQRVA
jgi:hypothetical protein